MRLSRSGATCWRQIGRLFCRHGFRYRLVRCRAVKQARRSTAQPEEEHRHDQVGDRDSRRDRDADGFTVHKAEERQHSAAEGECGRFRKLLVDDERANGAKHQPRKDGATAQRLQAGVENADAAELGEADSRRAGASGAERAVHQRLAPAGQMRRICVRNLPLPTPNWSQPLRQPITIPKGIYRRCVAPTEMREMGPSERHNQSRCPRSKRFWLLAAGSR